MRAKKLSTDSADQSIDPTFDLLELAQHLRKEYVFVSNEKNQLQRLNERVLVISSRVFNTSYISREQRLISLGNTELNNCFNGFNRLESVQFIESHKKLGSNDSQASDLLSHLRKSPEVLAKCLISYEKSNPESVENISQIILSSLFANCILNDDKIYALNLMKHLICLELSVTDNPRRLLRYNWCAFSHIYRMFCDQLLEAKPFLTAALYEPVMQLLAEDDLFLDIDPNRAAVRFPASERIRHFGKEGTQLYYENLQKYRIWTINKLANLVTKFVDGIHSNIFCFPQSLSWIIRQVYNLLIQNKNINVREIIAICSDLIFSFFICPAILSPDLLGITDAHVSHISRFNLQQIAQIIQILALSKWEEMDHKLDELYSKITKEGITKLLDHILEKRSDDLPQEHNNLRFVTRSSVFMSELELKLFLGLIKSINLESDDENVKKLKEIGEKLLEKIAIETNEKPSANASVSPDNSPRNRRSILNRVTKSKSKAFDSQLSSSNSDNTNQSNANKAVDSQVLEVLVIPIASSRECPGMLTEEKVLKTEQQKRSTKVRLNLDLLLTQNEETESVVSAISGSEKRTRFSLSQDQESIGTSDNLEAISEAASNHSVESSLDLENENDNMSDMVSANVSSGRATPNVSGRDTPSSHSPNQSSHSSDEDEEIEAMTDEAVAPVNVPPPSIGSGTRRLNAIPITQPNRPNNRDDIEDKFGKFDIKPVAAVDETKSMLSDTWSTDVLGSDSEAFEQTDGSSGLQASAMNMFGLAGHPSQTLQSIIDNSETASQSDAWSTDVLTSDTERLQEFDPDDTASVTRSEPEEDNFSQMYDNVYSNVMESPKNGTLKQRNVKFGSNPPNYSSNLSQDMNDPSLNSNVIRPKNISNLNLNPHKIINKCEADRNVFGDSTEANDHFADSLPMSLSPTLLSHNMQSLGRLSFDLRKLDEDTPVRTLLQDNICSTLKPNAIPNNASLVSELLSLDMNEKSTKPPNPELANSLIDFENEISSDGQPIQSFNGSDVRSANNDSLDPLKDLQIEEVSTSSVVMRNATITSASKISVNISAASDVNTQSTSKPAVTLLKQTSLESTGAIPKTPKQLSNSSIRLQYSLPDDDISRHSNRKGFFKLSNFKSTFKEKMRSFKDKRMSSNDDSYAYDYETSRINRMSADLNDSRNESSDEILAKYRAKGSLVNNCEDSPKSNITVDAVTEDDKNESLDPSESLNSTKKKLRRVFASIDLVSVPAINENIPINNKTKLNEVTNILKILLAEAICTRHSSHSVLLHETLRSIQSLDERTFQKLFWSLKEDYKKRNVYIAYLTRSRQQLLSTLAYFETIIDHIDREKSICSQNLISISVKQFLERKERSVQLFIKKFQSLIAADEKTQLVDKFMGYLENCLNGDTQWQSATDQQILGAKPVIERYVMSQIYITALYPNGDGDVLRDQILHKHIQRLSTIITPNHKDLGIPKIYHSESPWPSAQQEIQAIGAHKTPRDKVKCVSKCCTNIMNLLSLAYDRSVPAADDLMPVLVFVLIKANPPSLLSTVQYVNSFYEKHFEGEDAYWWTQFCSAVEFIKTMD